MPLRLIGALSIRSGLRSPRRLRSPCNLRSRTTFIEPIFQLLWPFRVSMIDRSRSISAKRLDRSWLIAARSFQETRDPCPSPQDELKMAKTMRPFPGSSVRPVRSESGGIVTLTYKWRELPGSPNGIGTEGTDVTVKVELVQEQGWKLKHESWVLTEAPGRQQP